jgi:hypothetical protein
MFASWLLTPSLTGCSEQPVVVSADTSCERFRHISTTDAQRAAVKAGYVMWERLAVQVATHSTEYDKACLKPAARP